VRKARALGFESVNFDLIYGLPFQTVASFECTLASVAALAPDRIALYAEDIQAAYRARMREYHSDKVAHLGEELRKLAHDKAIEIQQAYRQLVC
jgi:oxygen-independent coproporphyrinogen-3 oxidase